MPRFIQTSNGLARLKISSSPSLASVAHSLSLLLNDTKWKLAEFKEELKAAKDERNFLLDNIWLLEAENRPLGVKKDDLKLELEKCEWFSMKRTKEGCTFYYWSPVTWSHFPSSFKLPKVVRLHRNGTWDLTIKPSRFWVCLANAGKN